MSLDHRFREISALFEELSELEPEPCAARLREISARDEPLARELQAMLSADRSAEGFLEPPSPEAIEHAALSGAEEHEPEPEPEPELDIDARLGAYRVVKKIASGGMGAVYLASRADRTFEGFVAIKVLRRELRSPRAESRLRHERQTLASLAHPLIARLLDGGSTPDGRPYLVMEYIEGLPIDRACAERALSLGQRLKLLLEVCEAVSHAHRRLVVHRDLKPSNILVTTEGLPKLLDFGIAKLLSSGDSGSSAEPTQIAFTPAYASPEQKRGAAIGTATDVFSLGRLLVTLLPENLAPLARAELYAIAARATSEREEDRYASVERFAEELERFRKDLPLEAFPSTPLYRARKFARRNSLALAVAAGGAAGFLAAGFALFAAWHAASAERVLATEARKEAEASSVEATAARSLAEERAAESDRNARNYALSLDFMRKLFLAPTARGAGPEMRVVDLLEDARAELERVPPQSAGEAAEIHRMLGHAFVSLAQYDPGLEQLELAVEDLSAELGEMHPRAVLCSAELGQALSLAGQHDRASALLDRAMKAIDEEPARYSAYERVSTLQRAARACGDRRELERGLAIVQRAIDLAYEAGLRPPLLSDLLSTASTLELTRDASSPRGLQWIEEASRAAEAEFGADHSEAQDLKLNLAHHALRSGRPQLAIAIAEPILAARRTRHPRLHPHLISPLTLLGLAQKDLFRHEEAIRSLREALYIQRETRGPDHHQLATCKSNLAVALYGAGQRPEAETMLREVVADEERGFGRMTSEYAQSLRTLGVLEEDRGEHAEAYAKFCSALEILRSIHGERHIETSNAWESVGTSSFHLGELEAATAAFEKVVAVRRELLHPAHPRLADALFLWSRTEIARKRWKLAADLLREAADVLQRAESPVRSRIVRCLVELAGVRHTMDDLPGARTALEEARKVALTTEPKDRGNLRNVLEAWIRLEQRLGTGEAEARRKELEALIASGG